LGLRPRRTSDRLPPSFGRPAPPRYVEPHALQPGPREAAPPFAPPVSPTGTANADGSFSGAIRTLTLNVKTVSIRPVDKSGERGPDYRVFAGQTDLGAAWKKISKDNNDYLSVKLDDISFGEPVNAALVVIDGVHSLVWSRSTPKAD
jgi:uncharacterized protein (DUF736 family)